MAVVYALPASGQGVCVPLTKANLREGVEDAAVIVVGTVGEGPSEGTVVVVPERYFKGAAESRSFVLRQTVAGSACDAAAIDAGTRVLLVLGSRNNQLDWPDASRVFLLDAGDATNAADPAWRSTEEDLEQALLIVFAIGLVMMRVWHRIDPS
jgi:hypothetical protein